MDVNETRFPASGRVDSSDGRPASPVDEDDLDEEFTDAAQLLDPETSGDDGHRGQST